MELPSELKQALERLQEGITDTADLETLRRAFQAGQIVLATGERAVAIGGSVEDTVIVTGDNNIVFKGATAESVREALQQVLERIASDRYAASLQEYFHALRRYCAELPYLTLTDIRPPKNLDEVYVPLRARQRENEPSPRKPAAQGASLTVEQVLRQAQTHHLLILGQPGAGKSTLLRQLAERAYDDPHAIGLDRPHLPLLLPLRALAHAEGSLEERLNQALQNELRLTRPLPAGFLDAWPQQLDTPWLFLLDGLDEVPADRYLSLKQWIGDLLAHPNIARVILTSRPSAYTEKEWESSRLSVYEIQPFTRDQTAELARRWFGEDASAFLQALKTVRSSVLTETPLLITIAAKVYLERKSLPERRAQLYQEFVDIWLDEARERGLRDELGADVLDLAQPSLAHLALAMTEHPDWTDEKSLIPVVTEYLNEQLNLKARAPAVAERFLRVMARRSGVFLKREEQYEWVHPTFREYFAALALNHQLESGKSFEEVLGERALQGKWEETIVALAEMYAKSVELVMWLGGHVVEQKHSRAAFLVKECWERSDAAASNKTRAIVVEALFIPLRDRYGYMRGRAAWALETIGAPAVEPLIAALRDPDADVRWRMAKALGNIRDTRAVEPLSAALCDPDTSVRWAAAEALGRIGNPHAVEPLIAALRNPDAGVRWRVAKALGNIRDTRAVEPLIAALHDPDRDVRWAAAKALGNIRDTRAVEPLSAALCDPDTSVRWRAAEALGKIGHPRAVEPLIAALRDPDADVRWRAAEALGKIGHPRAVEPLIAALRDPDASVRWHAAEVLRNIRDTRAVEPLIAALRDPDKVVPKRAAKALGQIRDTRAVEPLIAALRNPDAGVRWRVAKALGQIRDTRAVEPLIATLRDPDRDVRWAAAKALGKIGAPAVEPLIAVLHDPDAGVRWRVATALGNIRDTRAVEPLIAALHDPDTSVRWRVAKALGNIRDTRAVECDPDASVRWRAAEALGKIGHPRAVEPLIAALRDPDRAVHWYAALALRRIGAPAVEPLIAALRDPDGGVRWHAAWQLGEIGDPRAVGPLIAALRDPEADVRERAAWALGEIGDTRALSELEHVTREDTGKTRSGTSVADAARKAIARIRERMEKTD
jgi:HEAT repeat protein/energy-coupling factor transporter ATP-binding protein EcfA2